MFVLSAEGASYQDKSNWSLHQVISVHPTKEEAVTAGLPLVDEEGEDTILVTDLDTHEVIRLPEGYW